MVLYVFDARSPDINYFGNLKEREEPNSVFTVWYDLSDIQFMNIAIPSYWYNNRAQM